ncbi:TetR/AcrR family transcriptional regulator [Pantoea tagorei]
MTTSRTSAAPVRERGRPRAFDTDTALDNAMIVFRQKGFHASSVADLSEAMNLTAGSIYKAFKDKRTLFLRVFERYISVRGADLRARLQPHTTGRARIAELLQFYLDSAREIEGRRGCLVVGSTVELQSLDTELSDLVRQAVLRNRNFFNLPDSRRARGWIGLCCAGCGDGSGPAAVRGVRHARGWQSSGCD